MTESTSSTDSASKCQKCGADFACLASDIKACHCSEVHLTSEQHRYMAARWKGCLCGHCLAEVAYGKVDYKI